MAVDFHKSITFDIMSAELQRAHNAIRTIVYAYDTGGPSDISDAIDRAREVLPGAKPAAREKAKPFDDVLG